MTNQNETTLATVPKGTPGAVPALNNPLVNINELEGFEDAVITPAIMQIVQPTSRNQDETTPPGNFRDTITGMVYKTLKVVPLKIQSSPGPRVLFNPDAGLGSDPICRSNDGIRPAVNAAEPQCDLCKNCKHSSWANYRVDHKTPPACKEKARMLFVERESGLPFIITFSGRSVTPANQFLRAIMRLAALGLSKKERLGIFDFTAEMYLKFITDQRGSYYVAQFRNITRVRVPGEFGPLYQELVKSRDVLTKSEVGGDEDAAIPTGSTSGVSPTSSVVDAEIVGNGDSEIPF